MGLRADFLVGAVGRQPAIVSPELPIAVRTHSRGGLLKSAMKPNPLQEPWVSVSLRDNDPQSNGAIPKVVPLTIGDPAMGDGSQLQMSDPAELVNVGSNPRHGVLAAGTPLSERGSLLHGTDLIKDPNLSLCQEAGLDQCGVRHSIDQCSQSSQGWGTPGRVTPNTRKWEEDLERLQ